MTVWKYNLPDVGTHTLELPLGARVLTAQMQMEALCLWVLVDPDARLEPRRFRVTGTGWEMPGLETLSYVGTVQQHDGRLIWHVFEVGR